MDNGSLYSYPATSVRKSNQLLRLIRASQPIMRTEIASRLSIDKSTVSEHVKPLVAAGILREQIYSHAGKRRARYLSFAADELIFGGVNLGVRRSQIGLTTLGGEVSDEIEFETPEKAADALAQARRSLNELLLDQPGRTLAVVGVSVPGMADERRRRLVFAPNLGWRNVDIEKAFASTEARIVVDNDSTAAAMYEARLKIRDAEDGLMSNFILVRSGTGIGVGLVIGSEVYRGTGAGRGVAGEFGHMTILAGGKPCVCGNRGCWEKYASASSASALYLGDRPPKLGEKVPRFVEIVSKASVGDVRSRKTLEKIGEYLGIGIANVIMGVGIPRVVISGRLVYGWEFIEGPMRAAIGQSIVGKTQGWSVEAGEPAGSAIGGALELAVEGFLASL